MASKKCAQENYSGKRVFQSDQTFGVLMLILSLHHGVYFQLPFFYGCELLGMLRDLTDFAPCDMYLP